MIQKQTVSKPEGARTTGDEAGSRAPSCSRLPVDSVICGDNCQVMRQWPDECIDLVVTSPPYDDLREYGKHEWDFYGVAWNLVRLLKPGGVVVWNVADATKDGGETGTSMRQALHFQSLGLLIHDTMIWNKGGFSQAGDLSVRYGQAWEYCFVLAKGKPKAWNPLIDRPNIHAGTKKTGTIRNPDGTLKPMSNTGKVHRELGIRLNVWEMPSVKVAQDHPAPFPEALPSGHIQSWSNPGDIVLDPFAGSGTTLKAAKELNRRYVGIEVNPEYVKICEERTMQETLPLYCENSDIKRT